MKKSIIGDTLPRHKRLRREKDWGFALQFGLTLILVGAFYFVSLVYFVSVGY